MTRAQIVFLTKEFKMKDIKVTEFIDPHDNQQWAIISDDLGDEISVRVESVPAMIEQLAAMVSTEAA